MIAASPSSPRLPHVSFRRVIVATCLALATATPVTLDGAPALTLEALTARVTAALPPGASIAHVSEQAAPVGWTGAEGTVVVMQVGDAAGTHTLAFVPLNWVGMQARGRQIDAIRYGSDAKVIISGDRVPAWLSSLAPHDASLASATGTTRFFAGEYIRTEAQVRTLLRKGGSARELAVPSFIALGVPAQRQILETALDSRHPARLEAIRALRHFPGKATRDALMKLVGDRGRDAAASRARLAALDTCTELMVRDHGPSLVLALQAERNEAVAMRLADEVNHLRFAPAAVELRRWLKSATTAEARLTFARTLATVRDPAAAAEIAAIVQAPAPRRASTAPATDAAMRRQLQHELHRLAGAWGPAVRGVRLSITMDTPGAATIHVENMGDGPFRYIPVATPGGDSWPLGLEVHLDGRRLSPPSPRDADLGRLADLVRSVPPGSSFAFDLPLNGAAPDGVEHTVTATWFELAANELTLRTGATAP